MPPSECHTSADVRRLIEGCLVNDPSAQVRLMDRFRGKVLALCYRMLGEWHDAEDAAQETFLRVSRSLTNWDSKREFEPWLLAIAANRCRSILARRARQPVLESLIDQRAPDSSHATARASEMLAEEVERALACLRPEWAQAFRLFHENELSYDQVAQEMGRPAGTVKSWVHRTRQELIRRLQDRDVVQGKRHAL